MTTSAGLGFTLLEARQTQPHIPVNEALINLDRAVAGRVPLDMAGLATKTEKYYNLLENRTSLAT